MRGEVFRLPARGKVHEQQGRRYAVVVQPDWLTLSTWAVAFTSTSAGETSFRPPVAIGDRQTLVICDQLARLHHSRCPVLTGKSQTAWVVLRRHF